MVHNVILGLPGARLPPQHTAYRPCPLTPHLPPPLPRSPPPTQASSSAIILNYKLGVSSITPSRGSMWGGATFTVTGYGFAGPASTSPLGLTTAVLQTGTPLPANVTVPITLANSSSTSVLNLQLGTFLGSTTPTTSSTATFTVYVYPSGGPVASTLSSSTTATTSFQYAFDPAYTPRLTSVSPLSVSPSTGGGALTVAWSLSRGLAADLGRFSASAAGGASAALVTLSAGTNALACGSSMAASSPAPASVRTAHTCKTQLIPHTLHPAPCTLHSVPAAPPQPWYVPHPRSTLYRYILHPCPHALPHPCAAPCPHALPRPCPALCSVTVPQSSPLTPALTLTDSPLTPLTPAYSPLHRP